MINGDMLWAAKFLVDDPEMIYTIHKDYFEAGADIGISATYNASKPGFLKRGLTEKQAADKVRLSVELVKRARDDFWAEEKNR